LSYTCSAASLGSSCSGVQSISISTASPVVQLPSSACTGGGGLCSTQDPNTVLVEFAVPSEPAHRTGNYTVQLTFTISTL
jgi:hypothetical protein